MQICSKVYCDRVYFFVHRAHCDSRGGSSFSPRGGGFWPIVHEPRSGEPIFFWGGYFTSREAASRLFFFLRFYEPRSGELIFFGDFTSREAASRFFFWLFYEPRSGEPIFFGLFYEPRSVFSSPGGGGGGGGVKPYCLRLSLRQSAIGTYCVGLDILWWRFSMHINFFFLAAQGGGGFKPPKPPPPGSATGQVRFSTPSGTPPPPVHMKVECPPPPPPGLVTGNQNPECDEKTL